MIHYGDITKISGNDVPIVDIITGGSPCQDLSIAGKREGLSGERSGLFMEQIRIIKEMRDRCVRTNEPVRPRYMVWENVPGAFSSNKGEDFRIVLEETARVVDKTAVIPRPEGGAKWTNSGCIMADGWSIAWRVHDAQFWGVPQRRRRISLVADFAGQSAPEILFERKGVCRDIEESGEQGQRITTDAESGTDEAISFVERAGWRGKKVILIQHRKKLVFENHSQDSRYKELGEVSTAVSATYGMGGNNQPLVVDAEMLVATDYKDPLTVTSTVRRLTPLECERLQGFPDGWTDIGDWMDTKGKLHKASDSVRYKALGNSIALPFWQWLADRIVNQYYEQPTMASLFDGIGGFPLVFSRAKAFPVWASEIEEFPIAVTKIRIG